MILVLITNSRWSLQWILFYNWTLCEKRVLDVICYIFKSAPYGGGNYIFYSSINVGTVLFSETHNIQNK